MARVDDRPSPARKRWEDATNLPMMIVAGVYVAVFSLYALLPDTDPLWRATWGAVILISWLAFLVDYIVRFSLSAPHRWLFVRYNLVDLFAIVLPVFRAFRLLRGLHDVAYFRRAGGGAARTRLVIYAASFAIVFVYMIALSELTVERNAPGATITSFGDALWWACVTLATVGYGDTYPVTLAGRFFAVLLMIGGVAIIGVSSATVISYLNERVADAARHPRDEHHDDDVQRNEAD